jgi:hypothetical protein
MRRFVLSCLAFAALLWAADRLTGAALDRLLPHTTTDLRRGMRRHPEVAVLGSSRALYHYAADTLERRLGMRAHNFGVAGQRSPLFHRAVAAMLVAEHPPRLAVLEVDGFTVAGDDDLSHLSVLLPYWRRYPAVKDVVLRRSRWERVKLLSRAYPYNSLALNMVVQRLRRSTDPRLGFQALHGRLDLRAEVVASEVAGARLDPLKVRYLGCLVRGLRAHGVRVVAVRSPSFPASPAERSAADAEHRALAGVLGELEVPFIDFTTADLPEFRDPRFFRDRAHLNEEGATRFTRIVADSLRPWLAAPAPAAAVPATEDGACR